MSLWQRLDSSEKPRSTKDQDRQFPPWSNYRKQYSVVSSIELYWIVLYAFANHYIVLFCIQQQKIFHLSNKFFYFERYCPKTAMVCACKLNKTCTICSDEISIFFFNLTDSQQVGTTMINKWIGFAVLRCHGKGSSYVNTV